MIGTMSAALMMVLSMALWDIHSGMSVRFMSVEGLLGLRVELEMESGG